jgi:hypothetical protein
MLLRLKALCAVTWPKGEKAGVVEPLVLDGWMDGWMDG